MTIHRFKWGPFPPNDVGRTAQHVRYEEKKGWGRSLKSICNANLCTHRMGTHPKLQMEDNDDEGNTFIAIFL